MPERSFFYKERQFPICARCTGQLIGWILAIACSFWYRIPILVAIFFLIPLIIDGVFQLKTTYISNNLRRLITGILFGYGCISILVITSIWIWTLGYGLGQSILH